MKVRMKMKQFRRVLILKWHYIEHECVKLGDINFLTGKNASGKSTFIDAMQLVLLGDTKGNFFNKAANEKSLRTLSSYVRGELSDNETGFEYLRNGDFSSIIAIEVYDTEKKKFFLIGIHMDVYSDGSLNHKFFIMDSQIPDNHFIQQKMVMNISELKAWSKLENINIEQFPSNKRYREVLLARLGHVNNKFFTLFKKAVSFSPITDIKGFITEFICDTDKKIEIKDMQDNIRYYENMKLEVEEIELRIDILREINSVYEDYKKLINIEKIQNFVLAKAREQSKYSYIERLNRELVALEESLKKVKVEISLGEENIKNLDEKIAIISRDLAKLDESNLINKYEQEIEELSLRVAEISKSKGQIFNKLYLRAGEWVHKGENNLIDIDEMASLEEIFKDEEFSKINIKDLYLIDERLDEMLGKWRQKCYELGQNLEELNLEKSVLEREISNLKEGNKSIPKNVRKLQYILENNNFGQVPMLCDLIEIKDKKWQNAIEAYLHVQKFYLIVDPEHYEEALRLYEKVKKEENIYDVGLVDLKKVSEHHREAKAGSLAEEISTEDVLIRYYMDYLLGGLMKVDRVEDLRKFRNSITPTCMLYKNFVARTLNPKRYEMPSIGKGAVKVQLALKEDELANCYKLYDEKLKEKKNFDELSSLSSLGKDLIEQLEHKLPDIMKLETYEKSIIKLKQELSQIDRSNFLYLSDKLEELNIRKKEATDMLIDDKAKEKRLEEKINHISEVKIVNAKNEYAISLSELKANFSDEFIDDIGLKKYDEAFKRLKNNEKIIENYSSSVKGAESNKNNKWNELLAVRSRYTSEFRLSGSNILSKSNDYYDRSLLKLEETELPDYKAKIELAIKTAQQEFRDDFLSKLKYNIDLVKEQISELNVALKNMNFGKDTYAFKITPNAYYKPYYDMITDPNLMEDLNIFTLSFQEKHGAVIDELFKKIVDVGEGAISADERAEIEANIMKYTDYRTYLDFDLVFTDIRGNKSHLSKMINKKSGGETQTPFYISVLASFYRLYRMNTKAEDTPRLIIFDEAFSKMDHERIEQCISLLKNLGFQALISAPTEKIANISPLVDKTLCVHRTKEMTFIKNWTKKELAYGK